ncbi:MAG: YbaK/EbsC family protein [Proteobacteria bacterium]|nr:YbaK/EbsC family protein [Pseudomonadota bacterium]
MSSRAERINRVHQALQQADVVFEARQLQDNTATSLLAAQALGCRVAQIAKTIVFRCKQDNTAVVAVLCGDDRVDTAKLATLAGGAVGKADADFVKQQCGFEIGGVAPLAYPQPLTVFLENRLRRFDTIWAAAGSAYAVFGIAPDILQHASGAPFADFSAPCAQ